MIYKLLDTGLGVLVARQPCLTKSALEVRVDGAPEGAKIIFVTEEARFVRVLEQGICFAPVGKMQGVVSVCVKGLDEHNSVRSWECESLVVSSLGDGNVLVVPNDMDMPTRFAQLFVENQSLRDQIREQDKKIEELSLRIDNMVEGWDLV